MRVSVRACNTHREALKMVSPYDHTPEVGETVTEGECYGRVTSFDRTLRIAKFTCESEHPDEAEHANV
jgi:hypothetical protein